MSDARFSPAMCCVAATLAVSLVVFGGILYTILHRTIERADELAYEQARYARLTGLREHASDIDHALDQARAALRDYAHPQGSEPARLGPDTQQRLRAAAERAGLRLITSQILPERRIEQIGEVPVAIMLEGDLDQMQAFLTEVATATPRLLVDSIALQPTRSPGGDTTDRLALQAVFSTIWLEP